MGSGTSASLLVGDPSPLWLWQASEDGGQGTSPPRAMLRPYDRPYGGGYGGEWPSSMASTWDPVDENEQHARARKYPRLQGGAQARCEMEARAAGWFGAGRPLLPEASDPSLADESERWIMMPQPERSGPECRPPFWYASRSMPTANTEALGRDEVGPQQRTSSTPAQCYPRICCVRRHAPRNRNKKIRTRPPIDLNLDLNVASAVSGTPLSPPPEVQVRWNARSNVPWNAPPLEPADPPGRVPVPVGVQLSMECSLKWSMERSI